MNARLTLSWLAALLMGFSATSQADDWPQWLGPQRDGVWREKGVVAAVPPQGLPIKWRKPVGLGYAGPAIAGGKVYVMDYVPKSGNVDNSPMSAAALEGTERVLCLDAASGELLWQHAYDRPYRISYPSGPRCTPSVAGGKVYAIGAHGNLWCLDAAKGKVVWSKDFEKDYDAKTALWGYASHPLVVGDTLYCVVGGQGSLAVAFDKDTGQEKWKSLSAEHPGYCPPTMIEHAGKQQLLVWHGAAIEAVEPASGKPLWSLPLKTQYGMSIAAPRKQGDLLFACGFGDAAALVRLSAAGDGVEVLWRGTPKTALYCGTATPFLEGEMIYGCDINTGALMGVSLKDGQRVWQTFSPTLGSERRGRYGTAFLVKHEERFVLFNELGDLIFARLSPGGYEEQGRFHVLEPTNTTFGRKVVWSHPAFAGRAMVARNDKEIVCVNLAAGP